ncbi:hypothetical protein [Nitratireductor sp. StC3]|uniref:hypothetical protein n=1 Tax=Nitratireductor sp. StC3 TaxID=2126741 RepID=UPI000D0CABDB|nr:hypothetical protein [Nitratireductor sp. StC3]PSM20214.1 hypothetical protein C7T96_03985 [Nitratireductor sp. StC3]
MNLFRRQFFATLPAMIFVAAGARPTTASHTPDLPAALVEARARYLRAEAREEMLEAFVEDHAPRVAISTGHAGRPPQYATCEADIHRTWGAHRSPFGPAAEARREQTYARLLDNFRRQAARYDDERRSIGLDEAADERAAAAKEVHRLEMALGIDRGAIEKEIHIAHRM